MKTQYPYLQQWTRPAYYVGAEWHNWYDAGVGQSRDSEALARANFDAMLAALKALPECDVDGEQGLRVVRESHWAVGWVEWIAIHETNTEALTVANRIMERLENYPVIDEELWSRYEDEECETVWTECFDEHERAEYLRRYAGRVYPMNGESVYIMLRAAVKGSWYHAANMLPNPSDLIA